MKLSMLLQYGTLWSLILAALGVAFAMVSHRRQVNASVYLDLTSRLHKLYQAIPASLRQEHAFVRTPVQPHDELHAVTVLDFLNLMNAAFTLYKSGYFSGKLWKALEAEAQGGLRLPLFREYWPELRQHFQSNPAFLRYVDRVQGNHRP